MAEFLTDIAPFLSFLAGLTPFLIQEHGNREKIKAERELKYFDAYFEKKCEVYSNLYKEYSRSFATPDSIPDYEAFNYALNKAKLFAPAELLDAFEEMDISIANRRSDYEAMSSNKISYDKYLSTCSICAQKRRVITEALNKDIANCMKPSR